MKFSSWFLGVLDKLDLAFAVDTSLSLNRSDVQKVKGLVDASLKSYQVTQQLAHIALVSFGDQSRPVLSLRSGGDRNRIKNSLATLPEIGGPLKLVSLAQLLQSITFSSRYGARVTAPKVAVVITKGGSDSFDLAQLPIHAAILSRAGIEIVIVKIGGSRDQSPLRKIPDTPMNYIWTQSVDSLPEIYGDLENRIAAIAGLLVRCIDSMFVASLFQL